MASCLNAAFFSSALRLCLHMNLRSFGNGMPRSPTAWALDSPASKAIHRCASCSCDPPSEFRGRLVVHHLHWLEHAPRLATGMRVSALGAGRWAPIGGLTALLLLLPVLLLHTIRPCSCSVPTARSRHSGEVYRGVIVHLARCASSSYTSLHPPWPRPRCGLVYALRAAFSGLYGAEGDDGLAHDPAPTPRVALLHRSRRGLDGRLGAQKGEFVGA